MATPTLRRLAAALIAVATLIAPAVFAAEAPRPLLRIVLMRHGVRSPTAGPAELAPYAGRPWPAWPVAPGMLTPHGAQGMASLGERYRRMLIAEGWWSVQCDALGQVVVIADSTPRNHDSGGAFMRGLASRCEAHYLALDTRQSNPLFHYGAKETKDDDAPASSPPSWPPAALPELQRVLLGCGGEACLARARAEGRKLLFDPSHDDAAGRAKALKTAGSLSENLMLAYAQGLPSADVAWGHGDAATLGRLIGLHNLQFALSKKSMPAAAQAASNLMAHVLASWQQAAGKHTEVAPLAAADARVVVLMGHDTNLANVAGVLGVDWHDARQPDDYPPGGALLLDLLDDHGQAVVRVSSAMPTLDALRAADFGNADALVQRTLALPPCGQATTCPLARVSAWLAGRLDARRIDATVPAWSSWPADHR